MMQRSGWCTLSTVGSAVSQNMWMITVSQCVVLSSGTSSALPTNDTFLLHISHRPRILSGAAWVANESHALQYYLHLALGYDLAEDVVMVAQAVFSIVAFLDFKVPPSCSRPTSPDPPPWLRAAGRTAEEQRDAGAGLHLGQRRLRDVCLGEGAWCCREGVCGGAFNWRLSFYPKAVYYLLFIFHYSISSQPFSNTLM